MVRRLAFSIVLLSIGGTPAFSDEIDQLRGLVSEACLANAFRCTAIESSVRRQISVLEESREQNLRLALYNRLAIEYNVAPNLVMALCEQAAQDGLGRESECAEVWASSISSQLPHGWDTGLVERFLRGQLGDALFETVSSRARDLTFEYWPERVGEPRPEKVLMLSANERGQFIAPIKINGRQLAMLVDTGASVLLLSWADAGSIGINLDVLRFDLQVMTASGASNFAAVTLDHVEFAGETFANVEALVAPSTATEVSLLGTPILGRFREVVISGSSLMVRN